VQPIRAAFSFSLLALALAGCTAEPVITPRDAAPDADADGFDASVDCDDNDAAKNPDAEEKCDSVDNDCDGLIDEADAVDAPTWYADGDGDTFGDANLTKEMCNAPNEFWVKDSTDCDDAQKLANPEADEICDNIDNDCDGEIDGPESANAHKYFWDFDGDGFGDPENIEYSCKPQTWLVDNSDDCDDVRKEVNPDVSEICDEIDNDCDDLIDDLDPSADVETGSSFYEDFDKDTFGNPDAIKMFCQVQEGYVANPDDCNDENPEIHECEE
jgi:hypothetical protein